MRPYQLVLVGIPVIWGSLAFLDPPQAPTKSLPTATLPGARKIEDATAWLRYPPADLHGPRQEIDEKDTYEVVASAKDLLISPYGGLHDKSFVKVSPDELGDTQAITTVASRVKRLTLSGLHTATPCGADSISGDPGGTSSSDRAHWDGLSRLSRRPSS